MSLITTGRVRKWITFGVALLLALSLTTWSLQYQRLPPEISLAAGATEGLSYAWAVAIVGPLEEATRAAIGVKKTEGSKENLQHRQGRNG